MKKRTKKPNIAILLNSFWSSKSGVSGGDIRLIQIFKRIKKEFGNIDIYCSVDAKKIVEEYEKDFTFILSKKSFDNSGVIKAYSQRSSWAKKEILKNKYDIVYASSDFFTDVLPAYEYKKKNPKARWVQCIFHVYPKWFKRPGNKLRNLLAAVAQKRSFSLIKDNADVIVNINTQVIDYLTSIGFDREKIYLNPCGVDLDYFGSIEAKKKLNQAVFLARLMPSKGIGDFAKIWKEVIKSIPGAKLKIIGGGDETTTKDLKKQFEEHGVQKNIELLGFLDNNKAFKIVKESQVFVFPSHEEGFGMAIAEAFACGLPAVAWNLPVYDEVFPKGIITAKEGDYKEFAKYVVYLMKNENKRKKESKNALEIAQKYSWDGIAKEELKIIKG